MFIIQDFICQELPDGLSVKCMNKFDMDQRKQHWTNRIIRLKRLVFQARFCPSRIGKPHIVSIVRQNKRQRLLRGIEQPYYWVLLPQSKLESWIHARGRQYSGGSEVVSLRHMWEVLTENSPCCNKTGGLSALFPERPTGILWMPRIYPSSVVTWFPSHVEKKKKANVRKGFICLLFIVMPWS